VTAPHRIDSPPADDPALPAWPDDAVEVARVLGAWGIKGGIKLKPFASDPQALFSSKRWFVAAPEGAGPRAAGAPALPRLLRIVTAREQGDTVVATAQELPDRDAAEAMKGARIFVSRASFPTPAEGEFYWVDLIGLTVVDRQGRCLGTVGGLIETGPHCVLSVQGDDAERAPTLIPFVDAYVDRVDREARRIVVDWGDDY
jgi:16S rRNA processing protein RimM